MSRVVRNRRLELEGIANASLNTCTVPPDKVDSKYAAGHVAAHLVTDVGNSITSHLRSHIGLLV